MEDSRFGLTPNPVASYLLLDIYCLLDLLLLELANLNCPFFLRLCVANFADHWRDEIYNLERAIVPRG